MSDCKHEEFWVDDDIPVQAICIYCGYVEDINPLKATTSTHSKATTIRAFWSDDFMFVYEEVT